MKDTVQERMAAIAEPNRLRPDQIREPGDWVPRFASLRSDRMDRPDSRPDDND